MEIKKVTDKYDFYKEGADYILGLGAIKRNENTKTELLITGLEDSTLLELKAVCGCTTTVNKIVDKNSTLIAISYNQCDPSFTKVIEIKYNKVKLGIIKIKGTCN